MRILFINTQDTKGGAAIVVDRLRKVLFQNHEAETSLVVGSKFSDREDVLVTRQGGGEKWEKTLHRLTNVLGLQYQYFPVSSRAILGQVRKFKPDIISLHNSHGGYFQTSLLKEISRHAPVVWTLHDMWSFTGNAAHTFGDKSWKTLENSDHLTNIYPAIGINTGGWLLRQKKKIYGKSDLAIVTPSRWLQSLAKESPVLEGKDVLQIYNGVDLNVFSPVKHIDVRSKLNIRDGEQVIMFSSEKLADGVWKGGNDLIEVLRIINEKAQRKLHLLMIGEGSPGELAHFSNLKPHFTGYIDDELIMAGYLAASDVFLYPTKADNLPNVLVEAISCGTPCVTFDVGGCQEIIVDGSNGYVVKSGDFKGMADATLKLLDVPSLDTFKINARSFAQEHFSLDYMGQQYHKLFTRLKRST
jgi:glycosyltransferase involved in cell wall biosynthesis